ncbi:hypothetical protein Poli38472_002834 [Pythium oligandrum]|uniref:non-specific serine/threonine protein kinase n=1 Tax=Pythium oligandrum TaxID=41045 RepID=A0A8K1FDH2_PYTOL|nr:hypothetical protein Poli38472_002834 [Pythium oligandrum]|eukprot:TMW56909.1 hypothetical protein Poli38472_002834 [Pythium oligandrum]
MLPPTPSPPSVSGPRPLQRVGSQASSRRRLLGTSFSEDQVRFVGEHYQLGAEIGRGGFGVVYAALDLRNGRSVAIKQVSLQDIDKDELLSIESEISLLRKLNHENIVKYYDTIKTQSHLHIVLELMENGSLAQFMKKFGSFSETLVAMYITQVLRGLAYLHEQGVLHRDVKGANILTTKEGLVKLADFGVAIKLNETQKSHSVVGSPYWMAPEVIEMAGWSFASDIWSVGCTIIELLSTKPPYFDLAPMAALFRIVQDDHPPLPERISPALHDFIMKCFMKEPRLRSSAEELLMHPWIAQIPKNKVEQSTQLVSEHVTSTNDRNAVLNTIKMFAQDQQAAGDGGANADDSESDSDVENWDEELGVDASPKPLTLGRSLTDASSTSKPVFQLTQEDAMALFVEEDDEDDAWTKNKPAKSKVGSQPSKDLDRWSEASLLPVEKRLSKLKHFREDDDEDELQFDDIDETRLLEAAAARQVNFKRASVLSVDDSKAGAVATPSASLDRFREEADDNDDFLEPPSTELLQFVNRQPSTSDAALHDQLFVDDEFEFEYSSVRDNHHKVTTRVLELLALLDPSMDDQIILDACSSLRQIFESTPSLLRDLMSQPGVVPNIMEALEMKKLDVLCAVLKVVNMIVADNQRFQENLSLVGLVPIIIRLTKKHSVTPPEMLGTVSLITTHEDTLAHDFSADVRLEAAKFVRQSCKTSPLTLQMFIACGGLPVLVDFLTVDITRPIDDQKELLRIALEGIFSVFRLQTIPKNDICRLFVKAGLLRKFIIVFNEIVHVLLEASAGVRSDDEAGDDASEAMEWSDREEEENEKERQKQSTLRRQPWTMEELHQMCDVFLLFSQGDAVVKEHMCDGAVLEGILEALDARDDTTYGEDHANHGALAAVVKLLKCIRNLSMDPLTLERLDRAGAIPMLVHLLGEEYRTKESTTNRGDSIRRREVENIVLQAIFYLCRLNRSRQTHAAQAGVVPLLIKVVRSASPLKQFALPLLCDFAHASPTARAQLWACDGVTIFLELLDDKYWQMDALKSICVWLVHDTVQVENVLVLPKNLLQLVKCFRAAQDTELENLLEPTFEMLSRSVRLNQALGRSALFVTEILKRLRLIPKAIVRKNLLKMLKCLFESHTSPMQFVVEYNFHPLLSALAQDANSMILVREIASQLLQAILVATDAC